MTASPQRVLVVEDNPLNLELAADLLEADGFAVMIAQTGQEGLALAQQERPDLILMDIQLPGMDGLDATRLLKTDPSTERIPVVALTAHAMRGDEELIFGAGCDGYITKPFDIQHFRSVIHRHLPRNGAAPGQG